MITTAIDFILYTILLFVVLPVYAHFYSAMVGIFINFMLQRRFVFCVTRNIKIAFVFSFLFSIGGLFIGTGLIYFLTTYTFLQTSPLMAKGLVLGIVFLYNYQTKKIAFGDKAV